MRTSRFRLAVLLASLATATAARGAERDSAYAVPEVGPGEMALAFFKLQAKLFGTAKVSTRIRKDDVFADGTTVVENSRDLSLLANVSYAPGPVRTGTVLVEWWPARGDYDDRVEIWVHGPSIATNNPHISIRATARDVPTVTLIHQELASALHLVAPGAKGAAVTPRSPGPPDAKSDSDSGLRWWVPIAAAVVTALGAVVVALIKTGHWPRRSPPTT